jgi:hypothetical protein
MPINSKARINKLCRRIGLHLQNNFRKLIHSSDSPIAIDVVLYWPPDQNSGEIASLGEVNRTGESPIWDFEIRKSDWIMNGEKFTDEFWFPKDLEKCVVSFFRKSWMALETNIRQSIACYLSLHDGSTFIRLSDGRRLRERERIDFNPPKRKKTVDGISTKPRRRAKLKIDLGDSISDVEKHFRREFVLLPFAEKRHIVDLENELGVWMLFNRQKLDLIRITGPSNHFVEGVWIGCHASKVEQILGEPEQEDNWSNFKVNNVALRRYWLFPRHNLRVSFDKTDRVAMIEKCRNF